MKKLLLIIVLTVLSIFSIGCDKKGKCVEGNCINGHGVITFTDGKKYVGQFKNGKWDGQGTFTLLDRKIEGQWKDGVPNGQCTITINGTDYKETGQWKNGKREGHGNMIWHGGDKYDGKFKGDKFNGKGTFTYHDGHKYVGEWKNNLKDGQGTMTYSDGEKYIGQFKNGHKEGHGILYDSNGKIIYDGLWKGEVVCVEGDCQNGQGYLRYSNECKYIGQFKNGKMNGQGTFYNYDGKIHHKGLWKDGEPVK